MRVNIQIPLGGGGLAETICSCKIIFLKEYQFISISVTYVSTRVSEILDIPEKTLGTCLLWVTGSMLGTRSDPMTRRAKQRFNPFLIIHCCIRIDFLPTVTGSRGVTPQSTKIRRRKVLNNNNN